MRVKGVGCRGLPGGPPRTGGTSMLPCSFPAIQHIRATQAEHGIGGWRLAASRKARPAPT